MLFFETQCICQYIYLVTGLAEVSWTPNCKQKLVSYVSLFYFFKIRAYSTLELWRKLL